MNTFTRYRSPTVTAAHSLEIEVELSGTYCPYEPTTRDDPGCDAGFADLDIEQIGGLKFVRKGGISTWATVDLLAGVDRKSAAYQQIVANLLAFIGEDTAADTLMGAVA